MPLPQYLSPTLMFSRASLENAFQLSQGDPLPRLGKGFRLETQLGCTLCTRSRPNSRKARVPLLHMPKTRVSCSLLRMQSAKSSSLDVTLRKAKEMGTFPNVLILCGHSSLAEELNSLLQAESESIRLE